MHTSWGDALRWIAAGLFWTQLSSAQGTPDAGGDCTPSRGPHECAERCPSFDTCYIDEGEGQLYYRVMGERFECDSLDCTAANERLGDYCCQRGEYAPSRGGGGGCALTAGVALDASRTASRAPAGLGALAGLLVVARRRRQTQSPG
ncbi:MAG TPA: hypothetical protein VMG12_07105 [Polyangiaceae bacterium]|nr:hypothetical protein [Polyangiaceae bacterium]